MTHNQVMDNIKKSISGSGLSIPLSHKKLNANISITRGMCILVAAESGVGKTSVTDSLFVLDIYNTYLSQTVKTFEPYWIYHSLERPTFFKRIKWICYKLWTDYQILIDSATLLGWTNKTYTISDELIQLISTFDEYFDTLNERMYMVSGITTPLSFSKIIHNKMIEFGKIHQIDENNKEFIYNDEKRVVFSILDHVGKVKKMNHHNTAKDVLDEYHGFVSNVFRDFYQGVSVDISQLNRSITSTDRFKMGDLDIKPEDIEGSSTIYQNCDIVIGLMNPYKRGLSMYPADNGYEISRTIDVNGKTRFRGLKIIKSSYGGDDLRIGLSFLGENGFIRELPKAIDMTKPFNEGTTMNHYDRMVLKGYQLNSKWYK